LVTKYKKNPCAVFWEELVHLEDTYFDQGGKDELGNILYLPHALKTI
jgi:hypothetical protein